MLRSIEGIFREGKIELLESAPTNSEAKVIVTFLCSAPVDLAEKGISEEQAASLRGRLKTSADDWDRPEMDVYDAV